MNTFKMLERDSSNLIYQEVQRFRQLLIWLLVVLVSFSSIYSIVQQLILGVPVGDNPAPDIVLIIIVIIVGLGLPILFYATNLTAEVRSDGLYIRYFPFHLSFHKIGFEDIVRFEVQTYSAIRIMAVGVFVMERKEKYTM